MQPTSKTMNSFHSLVGRVATLFVGSAALLVACADDFKPEPGYLSLFNGKHELKKISLKANCLSAGNMLFGVLTDVPSTYDVLNDVKPLTGFARVAH